MSAAIDGSAAAMTLAYFEYYIDILYTSSAAVSHAAGISRRLDIIVASRSNYTLYI